jgi:hypothetical protein
LQSHLRRRERPNANLFDIVREFLGVIFKHDGRDARDNLLSVFHYFDHQIQQTLHIAILPKVRALRPGPII